MEISDYCYITVYNILCLSSIARQIRLSALGLLIIRIKLRTALIVLHECPRMHHCLQHLFMELCQNIPERKDGLIGIQNYN